ncbi:MAG: hypothetical protein AB1585_00910 [Thermodesulfobacteriota bacterium]
MRKPVKILHIDSDYQPHHIIIQEGLFIHSKISMELAVDFLKSRDLDMVISEPHQRALLSKPSVI